MVTFIAHHVVTDYEAWISWGRESAQGSRDLLAQMGVVNSRVYRTADNSEVFVMHTCDNLEAAQKMAEMAGSAEHIANVEKNGGAPPYSFWIAEEVEI